MTFLHLGTKLRSVVILAIFMFSGSTSAQEIVPEKKVSRAVRIQVEVQRKEPSLLPVWSFFGYDEPNYTYAPNGKKLLQELHRLTSAPVYIRVHNLLTTGDGSASLKWGSTNAYTEDGGGKAVYDWAIVDRIFDTFRDAGVKPLVEVGFMPEALSVHPHPYRHSFPEGSVFTGWAYPPNDYIKWQELVYQFAKHLRERYGPQEVKTWLWEIWNEPDIDYWKGSREDFFKLYDYSAAAILRADPGARIGGPETTGAASEKAAEFLRAFLEHCARGTNAATGKIGAPLAFVSFHPKGAPQWKDDHVRMGLGRQLLSVRRGFEVISSFPEWKSTPVILGEWDPEGCAACSAKNHPENAYRNGALYAVYTAEAFKDTLTLAQHTGVNLLGLVSWSFEFEQQPYFEGFRELATNGVDKPVLNTFRMLGMLPSSRVALTSSASPDNESVLNSGSAIIEGVDGLAATTDRELDVMVWNYKEEDIPAPPREIEVAVTGLPESAQSVQLEEFRIDSRNSNSFTAWQALGRPQSPTPEQQQILEAAGQLKKIGGPVSHTVKRGNCVFTASLPVQSVLLLRLRW